MKQMVLHLLNDVKVSVKNKQDADSTRDIDGCFDVDPIEGLIYKPSCIENISTVLTPMLHG
jgi:hypothetical protein